MYFIFIFIFMSILIYLCTEMMFICLVLKFLQLSGGFLIQYLPLLISLFILWPLSSPPQLIHGTPNDGLLVKLFSFMGGDSISRSRSRSSSSLSSLFFLINWSAKPPPITRANTAIAPITALVVTAAP